MFARYLKVIVFAFIFILTINSSLAVSISPGCFSNLNEFMVSKYGLRFSDDENIQIAEKYFGKVKFNIVVDLTSGTNNSIALLRTNLREELCLVLSTPPVAQFDLVKVNAEGVPIQFRTVDQAPPGLPENEIFYRLNGNLNYTAAVCNQLTWKNNKIITRQVACSMP